MSHLDLLMERLKHYDEITLLELLNINTEELLERFQDRIYKRREYLYRELEVLSSTEEDLVDEFDGFQIIDKEDYDDE